MAMLIFNSYDNFPVHVFTETIAKLVVEPNNLAVKKDEQSVFVCRSDDTSRPIKWFHTNVVNEEMQHISIGDFYVNKSFMSRYIVKARFGQSELTIKASQTADAGVYACTEAAKHNSSTSELIVLGMTTLYIILANYNQNRISYIDKCSKVNVYRHWFIMIIRRVSSRRIITNHTDQSGYIIRQHY